LKSGEAQRAVLDIVNDPNGSLLKAGLAYRKMLQTHGRYDWTDVNSAIIDRWSREGHMRMMRIAWQNRD